MEVGKLGYTVSHFLTLPDGVGTMEQATGYGGVKERVVDDDDNNNDVDDDDDDSFCDHDNSFYGDYDDFYVKGEGVKLDNDGTR